MILKNIKIKKTLLLLLTSLRPARSGPFPDKKNMMIKMVMNQIQKLRLLTVVQSNQKHKPGLLIIAYYIQTPT